MLDLEQRIDRYLAQTGRRSLTPRQARRVERKARHQSAPAQLERMRRGLQRSRERNARASVLTPR
jgi:hypothetical protein